MCVWLDIDRVVTWRIRILDVGSERSRSYSRQPRLINAQDTTRDKNVHKIALD